MKNFLKEPLVHFVLLGLVIYGYYLYVTPQSSQSVQKEVIAFSSYDIETMKNSYRRHPSEEINGSIVDLLVKKSFFDEVFLQEAFALGLEKQDDTIRKKLLKKMDYILSQNNCKEPSEKQLYEYFEKQKQNYQDRKSVRFVMILFYDLRNAQEISKYINYIDLDDAEFSTFRFTFEEALEKYGRYFANELFRLQKGVWSAPLHLKDKNVLVKIISFETTGKEAVFENVEFQVYSDYKAKCALEQKRKKIDKILSRYILKIEDDR